MVWGVLLIVVGVVFLLDRLHGSELVRRWRDYWPALIVLAGLGHFVPPTDARCIAAGAWWIVVGAWCYVSVWHLWGLSFHNSWPILLIAAGLALVLRPLPAKYRSSPEGERPET